MSDQDNLHEKSTAEMETKNGFDKILNAVNEMRQDFSNRFDGLENRLDNLEKRVEKIESEQSEIKARVIKIETSQAELTKFVDVQFEAIRQGLVKNYAYFERLEGQVAENRAVIFSTKAITTELREEIFLLNRELKHTV